MHPIGMNPGHEGIVDELQAASNKMKKWNDFYESMDPKKHNPMQHKPIDVTRAASVKYFSVYPRKAHGETSSNASGRVTPAENTMRRSNLNQPTAETSFQGERYTRRSTELGNNSNRGGGAGGGDAGHTNFAWVD